MAQGIQILRDTETEDMLRNFEAPLAKAAGLNVDATKVWLVGDPEVNAFASFGPEGSENIFMFTGIILYTHTANELIGVMAHETGHIKAGHLIRGEVGMQKAMIPMLLSMVVGVAAMIAGAGQAGMVIMGMGQAVAAAQFTAFTRVQESTADQIGAQLLNATHQSLMGMYTHVRPHGSGGSARRLQDRSLCRRSSQRPGARDGAPAGYRRCLALSRRQGFAAGGAHI